MLSRNSVPYSLNLIGFENEGLITQNNANTTRIIQNKESILSGLETGYSSYSDGNNVRGSHRRTYQKSSKNRHRKLMNRTSARMVNSDGVNENSIPEENSTPEETFTYDDVPGELLFCHVCNIMVSSSQEFAAHLQDVTHDDMMTCLENQFQEEAEELRRKGKAKYERDFNELGRANVKIKCHCVMCDADIPELLSKHRRSESHQTLRKYLHPECDVCVTKFKTRIEWTRHLLTPTHLMKIAATNVHRDTSQNFEYRADELEPVGNVDSGLVKEEKEEEQTEQNNADIRDQINFFCKEEEEEEQTEQNNADIRDQINFFSKVKEEQEEDEEEEQNIESAEGEGSRVCSGINEYCNVVGGDSRSSDHSARANMEISGIKNEEEDKNDSTTEYFIDREGFRVPVYKEDRLWGMALLKEVTGHVCRGCKRFFDCDDLANAHCRSKAHYDVFISLMKRKILYENSSASKTSPHVRITSKKRKLSTQKEEANQKFLKRL